MPEAYDAVLIVSVGGPAGMHEVRPFVERVLRGTQVPPHRMRQVVRHYQRFGGVSPLNAQIRQLVAALSEELSRRGPNLPVYWGNRNWHPLLADTLRSMQKEGVKKALAFLTSPYSSYSGCRQYLEDIERARHEVGEQAPLVERLRGFYNHPGFIEPNRELVEQALSEIPVKRRAAARLLFSAHSIPLEMADTCDYVSQLKEASRLVAEGVGRQDWVLVFQSRSGPPQQVWLEPDICIYLEALPEQGVRDVVVVPIGFVSDHMEVQYDLDTEARGVCQKLGINMVRSATVGTHPLFVSMIRELIMERLTDSPQRRWLGSQGPLPDFCRQDCCRYQRPSRPWRNKGR